MAEIRGVIVTMMLFIVAGCGSQKAVVNDGTQEFLTSLEFQSSLASTKQEIASKNDQILHAVGEQSRAITTLTKTLEASLVKSEPKPGSEVIKSALQPPAKNANDSQTSTKIVAEPGAVPSETLVELATRLYAQGVNTHMKTEAELKAIDAQLNGGAPVGAIFQNNRASAVTSQRSAVRLIPRGKSVVRWQRNSAGQTCGPNGCY